MKVIKEFIKENNLKTVVLQRFFRNASLNKDGTSNPGATDNFYIVKYLREECGIEPIIATYSENKKTNDYRYVHFSNIDWNEVDLCINQTNLFNLFGGGWHKCEIEQIKTWTDNYHGLTYILYTDPAILWTNPFRLSLDRNEIKCHDCDDLGIDESYVDKFNSKKIESLFIGRDYELFKSMCKSDKNTIWPTKNHEIHLVPYIIEHEWINEKMKGNISFLFDNQPHVDDKIYDIVYFGSNRSHRSKIIKSIFKNDTSLKKLWIGYDPKLDPTTTTVIDSIPRLNLKKYLNKCKISLVIGDPAHNNNIFTYRIFENAIFGCLSVIWHEFDESHYIFKNKELERFYIKNIEDIKNLIEYLNEDFTRIEYFLNLQKEEVERYSKLWK